MSHRPLTAFVSSRMEELAAEREVIKAELKTFLVEAWEFEADAGARPQSVQQTFLKKIEEADFYIGIFWRGYGEYTIEEFDHAIKLGKSCLVYEKRSDIESRDPRLTAFLEKIGRVQGLVTIKWFETPEDLGKFVKDDVDALRNDRFRNATQPSRDVPFQAPAIADQYVERTSVMDQLRKTLLAFDENGEPRVTRAALHGMGGVGKTNIASAFAHLDVVRKRFPDGVLWVTLGQNPDLLQRLSDWGRALHDTELVATSYVDQIGGTSRLRSLLSNKACLLVVDDVWKGDHAKAFLVGGPQCLMLITTRLSEIGEEIGASTIELTQMTPVEALTLVENFAGPIADAERADADWLMKEVEYLPLAVELIGAQVKKLGTWRQYRGLWENQKLKALKRGRESEGPYNNLWDSLELSVSELSGDDQERYYRLGVFHEDTSFPAAACARLWGCDDYEATEVLIDFAGRALLREQTDSGRRLFFFHDLLYEFVRERLGSERLGEAHRTLVAGYRSMCDGEWHKVPDDGYFFGHLTEHLHAAGLIDELYNLISREWMDVQFRRVHSHRAFAADLARVLAVAQSETPPNLLQIVKSTVISATLGSLATRSDPEALAALAHIGEVDRALGHAELIQEPARKSRAYRLIAAALIGRGDSSAIQPILQESLKAARSVKLVHFRCPVLCDLAGTMIDAGEVELARQVASEAESAARNETHKFFLPKLLIETAWAHVRAGNTEQSNALAEVALQALTDEDSVQTLAYLVRLEAVFHCGGSIERAGEIRTTWVALFEKINKMVHDVYLGYAGELSLAFLEAHDINSAVIIAERWMGQSWKAADVLARVALALIETNDLKRASEIADAAVEMVREEVKGETYPFLAEERISSIGSVTDVLGGIGREDIAIVLANAAPDAEGKSHSLGTLALALAQRNSPDSARRAADASLAASQRLTDEDPEKAMWLAATAKTLNTLGKNTKAMPLANLALSLVDRWTGDDSQINTNRIVVAEILSELGDNTKALGVVDTIGDNQQKAEALITIIRSRTATLEECKDIAKRVVGYIDNLRAVSKPKLFGSMARSLAVAGLDKDAIRVAHLAISSAGELEEHDSETSQGLCDAAHAFILTGRFDEARQAVDKIKIDVYLDNARSVNLRIRVLNALATALENAGQHERAIDTINLAQEMLAINRKDSYDLYTYDADTLIDLAKTLSHLGNADDATEANQRALKLSVEPLRERGA